MQTDAPLTPCQESPQMRSMHKCFAVDNAFGTAPSVRGAAAWPAVDVASSNVDSKDMQMH